MTVQDSLFQLYNVTILCDGANEIAGIVGRIAEYGDAPERNPGFHGNVVIENCSNTGAINGGNISGVQLGGIVGIAACQDNAELYINTCQNSRNVSCDNGQLGRVLGAALMYGNGTIILSDCENSASVTSKAGNTGGLMGDDMALAAFWVLLSGITAARKKALP